MNSEPFKKKLTQLIKARRLSAPTVSAVRKGIRDGKYSPAQIGALLAALRMKASKKLLSKYGCMEAWRKYIG